MKLLLSVLAWTLLALVADVGNATAQEPGRVYKIGWLWFGRPDAVMPPPEKWTDVWATFRDGMRDHGYVVGKNLVFDARHGHGDAARLAAEADALVASGVDVIVSLGTAPTAAALKATKSIPIVFAGVGNPLGKGFVANLARPGGNVTGTAVGIYQSKYWQLLREIAPATRRAAGLVNGANNFANTPAAYRATYIETNKADAAAAGLEWIDLTVTTLDEIETKFAALGSSGDTGVVILTDDTLFRWRASIAEMALRHRLPMVCGQFLGWAAAGCLATYGEDTTERFRRSAAMAAKVLRGGKPGDIPVEQPTKFKLIINAKTAKALDLAVPSWLLAGADAVIE